MLINYLCKKEITFMNHFNFILKKGLLCLVLILTSSFYFNLEAQENQQFYNYGFESWIHEGTEDVEPAHWHSFMSASGSFNNLMSQQIEPSSAKRPGSQGSRSARIFSKKKVGIVANGNMTTGRINAGSMSPSGSSNYNYTQRNSDYCTPITVIPDSLTVWVAFRAEESTSYASVMTAIHGDVDLKQLSSGGYDPSNMVCATAKREYARTCASGNSLVWKRLSIPFTSGSHNNPKYILTTFSTNSVPGGGDKGDEVFVDDIYLIYNPHIEVDYLAQTEFVFSNDASSIDIEIPFNLTGSMSVNNLNKEANQVIAQLSDADGSFDNPTELGRVTTDESGVIHGVIPSYIKDGDAYRVRVVSTNYPMTSEDNGTDISIYGGNGIDTYFLTNINVYPNPADEFVKVTSNNIIREIHIFSIDGRMVYSDNINHNETTIDLSSFNKGTYIVRMILDGEVVVKRIVKI